MISHEELMKNWFFVGFAESQIDALLALGRSATCAAGEKILVEGGPAESFYILIKGAVSIKMKTPEYGELVVSTLKQTGEIFGWSALVEEGRSTATVECLEETTILSFKKEEVQELFVKDPVLGYRFMKRLASLISRRLENTRALLIKGIS